MSTFATSVNQLLHPLQTIIGLGWVFSRAPDVLRTFPSRVERASSPARTRCIAAIKLAEKTKLSLLLQEARLLALLDTRVPNRLRQFDKLEGAVPSTRLAANCMFRNEAIKVKTHKRNFTLYASSFFCPPSGRSGKFTVENFT